MNPLPRCNAGMGKPSRMDTKTPVLEEPDSAVSAPPPDMEASIAWQQDAVFAAVSGSGHEVTIDGPPDSGGRNTGARPMELMLMGLAGCAAFDVVHILRKGRANLSRCDARVTARRADTDPRVFTSVHLQFTVAGEDLSPKKVSRAIELSAEKYCSASIMLQRAGVAVTHGFELEHKQAPASPGQGPQT